MIYNMRENFKFLLSLIIVLMSSAASAQNTTLTVDAKIVIESNPGENGIASNVLSYVLSLKLNSLTQTSSQAWSYETGNTLGIPFIDQLFLHSIPNLIERLPLDMDITGGRQEIMENQDEQPSNPKSNYLKGSDSFKPMISPFVPFVSNKELSDGISKLNLLRPLTTSLMKPIPYKSYESGKNENENSRSLYSSSYYLSQKQNLMASTPTLLSTFKMPSLSPHISFLIQPSNRIKMLEQPTHSTKFPSNEILNDFPSIKSPVDRQNKLLKIKREIPLLDPTPPLTSESTHTVEDSMKPEFTPKEPINTTTTEKGPVPGVDPSKKDKNNSTIYKLSLTTAIFSFILSLLPSKLFEF